MDVSRAPRRQRADHDAQLPSLVGQCVLGPRGMLRVEPARDQPVLLHQLEAPGQQGGRDAGQGGMEVLIAARALEQVAHDQERPPLAHQLQRLRHRTALPVPLRHTGRIPSLTRMYSDYILCSDMPTMTAAPSVTVAPIASRTRLLLDGAIAPTLLRRA